MLPLCNNTGSHGLKPVKIDLSASLNMKEATLFKRHLRWTIERNDWMITSHGNFCLA
jgi:hypothetical protein